MNATRKKRRLREDHPTQSREHWVNGFAKRPANFEDTRRLAETWRWESGQTLLRINHVALLGTPDLSKAERNLLLVLVDCLNQKRLEMSDAFVWPGNAYLMAHLDCDVRTLQRLALRLEVLGYIIRDYGFTNRKASKEAYTLAPMLARFEELEARVDMVREEIDAEWQRQEASVLSLRLVPDVGGTELSGEGDKNVALEQSHYNYPESEQTEEMDEPAARHDNEARCSKSNADGVSDEHNPEGSQQTDPSLGSASRARVFVEPDIQAPVDARGLQEELELALEVAPLIAEALPALNPQNPRPLTVGELVALAKLAQDNLPEPERNNHDTVRWAVRRHGLRAVSMLAVALCDPAIQHPARFFGWLAVSAGSAGVDLRVNLNRALKARGGGSAKAKPSGAGPSARGRGPSSDATRSPGAPERRGPAARVAEPPAPPSLTAGPGADHPAWQAIDAVLRQRIKVGVYGSWFARLGFDGIEDGVMTITTPNAISADRLKADHIGDLLGAARAAGQEVTSLIITARSGNPASRLGSDRPGEGRGGTARPNTGLTNSDGEGSA